MSPLILNTNFIKRETKIGYPQGSNSGPPLWLYAVIIVDWEPAQESPRSCKCSSTNNEASLEFYIPIHKVLEQPCWHFTSLKLHKCSQIPHPQQHQPPVEQKPITIGLTIYKHSTCTKFRVSFQSLRLTQGNLGFSLLTPKIKRQNLRFTQGGREVNLITKALEIPFYWLVSLLVGKVYSFLVIIC